MTTIRVPIDELNFALPAGPEPGFAYSVVELTAPDPECHHEYKDPQEVDISYKFTDRSLNKEVVKQFDGWDTEFELGITANISQLAYNVLTLNNTSDPAQGGLIVGNPSPVVNTTDSAITTVTTSQSRIESSVNVRRNTVASNALVITPTGLNVPNSVIAWDNITKVISFTDNKGNSQDIDLSQFVSDIHVNNAAFDPLTSILTLHMEDVDGTPVPDITIDLGELSKSSTEDSPTVVLTGNGTGVTPLRADVQISQDPVNILQLVADGLLVTGSEGVVVIPPAATIDLDWAALNMGTLELDQDTEFNAPTNIIPGTVRHILVTGDSNPGHEFTFNSIYKGLITDNEASLDKHWLLKFTAMSAGLIVVEAHDASSTLPKPPEPSGYDPYSGTGWYKDLNTGIVYNKDIPQYETARFANDPKEYISAGSDRGFAVNNAAVAATSNITSLFNMPWPDKATFNEDISHWDVSNVTNMNLAFNGATAFNGDISNWDTSNVTTFEWMFTNASSFNQPIGDWDVSNVTNMTGMFDGASSFNQDLSSWCVDNIPAEPASFDVGTTAWDKVGRQPVWGTCP